MASEERMAGNEADARRDIAEVNADANKYVADVGLERERMKPVEPKLSAFNPGQTVVDERTGKIVAQLPGNEQVKDFPEDVTNALVDKDGIYSAEKTQSLYRAMEYTSDPRKALSVMDQAEKIKALPLPDMVKTVSALMDTDAEKARAVVSLLPSEVRQKIIDASKRNQG